jgi:hypothetical protein
VILHLVQDDSAAESSHTSPGTFACLFAQKW